MKRNENVKAVRKTREKIFLLAKHNVTVNGYEEMMMMMRRRRLAMK